MDARDIIIAPVVSEKSYMLNETGAYTFKVHSSANKIEIRNAVQELFKVKVTSVNTLNVHGKARRQRTKQAGKTSDWKKAIVTLQPGQKLEGLFGSV